MSTAPGVTVTSSIARSRSQSGVIPGTLFVPMITEKGPHDEAVECGNIADVETVFGGEVASSTAWRELRAAFAVGAPRAFVARMVGPSPVKASKSVVNGSATTALTLTAVEYGSYWNSTTIAVAASGGSFVLTIVEPDGTTHVSDSLADLAAAVAWVGATADTGELENFTMSSTGSTDPVTAAAAALTGGTDDAASITETQRQAALDLFEKRLGCGVVIEPGTTTTTGAIRIAAHLNANNRLGLVDIASGTSVASAVTHAETLQDIPGAERMKLNASWARISGTTPGTTELVGFSSLEAGMMGRNDQLGVPAGQPAAGGFGVPDIALSLETEYSTEDRATLNDAHVNVAIREDGEIKGYGNRSLSTVSGEELFSRQRVLMIIQAECEQAAKRYVHRMIDGDGHVLAMLLGDLIGICQRHKRSGALYGATDDDAFRVQVFEVNTDENLLAGELNAAIDIRPSGAAEFVRISITSHADQIAA